MSQIHFFSPEQEALIPEYQEKWKQIYLSTEPIDRLRAEAAVKGAYAVMGQKEPEVVFCTSPRAALEHLQEYISPVEVPQNHTRLTPEEILSNPFQFFGKATWETLKMLNKQQKAGTKPLHDLHSTVSGEASKSLIKHIERSLPKNLTTQDIVEQAFLGSYPLVDKLGKDMARQGDPTLSRTLEDRQPEDWQESFTETASAVETQLGWLPAKGLFFRGWLKQALQGALIGKVQGLKHPRFKEAILILLSLSQRKFFLENPPILVSELVIHCIWLDFAFSVLNYPHNPQKWAALQGLVKYCGWIFAVENLCVICDRPTSILLDENHQLHGEGGPAVQFADGFVVYAYHGTPLTEKYGTVPSSQWQAQWVLEERNKTLQKMLIQAIGAVRLCQELPLVEVDAMQDYTLLKLENVGVKATFILKRIEHETGHLHAVFVPWHTKSVRSAIQYAHQNFPTENFPIPSQEEVN